jgi:hypothetical protein
MKYNITAMTNSAIDVSHIHSDIKNLFTISNAKTIKARMTATVLICNSTTSFKDACHDVSPMSSIGLSVLLVQQ